MSELIGYRVIASLIKEAFKKPQLMHLLCKQSFFYNLNHKKPHLLKYQINRTHKKEDEKSTCMFLEIL